MTNEKQTVESGDCCNSSDPCGLCALFFSDFAIQELEMNWDDPVGLRRGIEDLFEEGFAQYAKPLFWRLSKIHSSPAELDRLQTAIDDRIYWGRKSNIPSTNVNAHAN